MMDRSSLDLVRGSANGARLGSFLWGSAASALLLFLGWGSYYWWLGLPIYVWSIAACVRSFFLGVWVEPGRVRIRSWFRSHQYELGEVADVDTEHYSGAGGAGVGWVPFIGAVRMIEIELPSGRFVSLPSTIGRRNRVLQLARRMRVALCLNPR